MNKQCDTCGKQLRTDKRERETICTCEWCLGQCEACTAQRQAASREE